MKTLSPGSRPSPPVICRRSKPRSKSRSQIWILLSWLLSNHLCAIGVTKTCERKGRDGQPSPWQIPQKGDKACKTGKRRTIVVPERQRRKVGATEVFDDSNSDFPVVSFRWFLLWPWRSRSVDWKKTLNRHPARLSVVSLSGSAFRFVMVWCRNDFSLRSIEMNFNLVTWLTFNLIYDYFTRYFVSLDLFLYFILFDLNMRSTCDFLSPPDLILCRVKCLNGNGKRTSLVEVCFKQTNPPRMENTLDMKTHMISKRLKIKTATVEETKVSSCELNVFSFHGKHTACLKNKSTTRNLNYLNHNYCGESTCFEWSLGILLLPVVLVLQNQFSTPSVVSWKKAQEKETFLLLNLFFDLAVYFDGCCSDVLMQETFRFGRNGFPPRHLIQTTIGLQTLFIKDGKNLGRYFFILPLLYNFPFIFFPPVFCKNSEQNMNLKTEVVTTRSLKSTNEKKICLLNRFTLTTLKFWGLFYAARFASYAIGSFVSPPRELKLQIFQPVKVQIVHIII